MVTTEEKSGDHERLWGSSSGDWERLCKISRQSIQKLISQSLPLSSHTSTWKLWVILSCSMKHNPDCNYSKRQNLSPAKNLFQLVHAPLKSVMTLFFFVLSTVRPLPGEPQCAGHPQAGGLRDCPHALCSPRASHRVSKHGEECTVTDDGACHLIKYCGYKETNKNRLLKNSKSKKTAGVTLRNLTRLLL